MTDAVARLPFLDLASVFVAARSTADLAALRGCLHPDVVVQSNVSPWPIDRERMLSLTSDRHGRLRESRIDVVRLDSLPDGFVLEEVLRGTLADGRDLAAPSCFIATCDAGQITALSQYSDSDASTALLDDRGRVWRLASTLARSSGRAAFTAVDVVRAAAALGLLVVVPIDPDKVDLDEFGSGVDERAERARPRTAPATDSVTTVPSPAPALPALDLMALAAHMARSAVQAERGVGGLADVIVALASHAPYRRQLAEAGIDPRALADEWVARLDALPADEPAAANLSAREAARLDELEGPPPAGWTRDSSAEATEPEARLQRIEREEARWSALAQAVQAAGSEQAAAAAIEAVRDEVRYQIAHSIRSYGTNSRTVDDAFDDALQAVLKRARTFDPHGEYGFATQASVAITGAVRGTAGGAPRRTST